MEQPYTRTVVDPTGQAHEITLSGWYWASLDFLHDDVKIKDSDIIAKAWRSAKKMEAEGTMRRPGDLAHQFAESFRLLIWATVWGYLNKSWGLSNDNWG
ncbi:hypothetical protein ACO0LM_22335 [Undibacterium sp. Di26W]|uniref:hypothetical protein n=1 Tax=Undibacterium sp. Di26W TaxID=3413035 RepID=UPI003BF2AA9D